MCTNVHFYEHESLLVYIAVSMADRNHTAGVGGQTDVLFIDLLLPMETAFLPASWLQGKSFALSSSYPESYVR